MSSSPAAAEAALLDVRHVAVEFEARDGETTRPVRDATFRVAPGQTLALVGESGSGKSLSALAVLGLLPARGHVVEGRVIFGGDDLVRMRPRDLARVRGQHIAMVFQDPLSSLNPTLRVGDQIAEGLWRHGRMGRAEARRQAVDLMSQVGIPDPERRSRDYPHQLSGGMRQRVMIAIAISLEPEIILADEPTTALDVTIQAQILRLLGKLQKERGLGLLLISHDLSVVAAVADRVSVMYAGRVVEEGPLRTLYEAPAHPYTIGLIRSVPSADDDGGELRSIPGQPPLSTTLPTGCSFHPRCPFARDVCRHEEPALRPVARPDHRSACHFAGELESLA